MPRRFWKLAPLLVLGGLFYLLYAGFCFRQLRFVPREEMCRTALLQVRNGWNSDQDRCNYERGYVISVYLPNAPDGGHPTAFEFDHCGRLVEIFGRH